MTILDQILVQTRQQIAADKQNTPPNELAARISGTKPCLDFHAALAAGTSVQLIAEVKRASPSAGLIRQDFDAVRIAQDYVAGGAACLSVLTDQPFFQGSLDYLRQIRQAVRVPLLRKDFIVDEYQLLQAREAGADCVLLIAECLSPTQLREFVESAKKLGMQTLVELYDAENLPGVIASGTKMIGVNNRDLRSFKIDLHHTLRLAPNVPRDRLLVGESGIHTYRDVQLLASGGVKGILVGESLMRQPDIIAAVKQLLTGHTGNERR
jgi:indole-3-glycerol phosphate synthase